MRCCHRLCEIVSAQNVAFKHCFCAPKIDFSHNLQMRDLEYPIGGAWLVRQYGIDLVMPFVVTSRIAGRRATHVGQPTTTESHVETIRPEPTLRGHLTFHLKHEVPHFELLSRVFARGDAGEVSAWVAAEPTGQYARRAAFLHEFFTGQQLPVPAGLGGGYHDAIGADGLVAATPERAVLNKRWRIRDNMPGTRAFCPMIVKAQAGSAALDLDVRGLIHALEVEFGAELLMRSAVWMTPHSSATRSTTRRLITPSWRRRMASGPRGRSATPGCSSRLCSARWRWSRVGGRLCWMWFARRGEKGALESPSSMTVRWACVACRCQPTPQTQ